MAKVLIMYFSKYGSTKKYAEWLASDLSGDLFAIKTVRQNILANYDIIILGSALYAGCIKGIDILLKNYEILKGKKLVIFTCGLSDYSKIENINDVKERIEKIIPENIRKNIKIYYLRGGINYKRLSFKHKIMMRLVRNMLMRKEPEKLTEGNKDFLETYGKTLDFMDKNSIADIVKYCEG